MSDDWRPTCGNFAESAVFGAVVCLKNLHGGTPGLGICNRCRLNPAKGTMPLPKSDATVQVRVPTAEELAKAEAARIDTFHRLWRELHVESASPDGLSNDKLDAIGRQLPCGECSIGYREFRQANPLPNDPVEHFAWTVKLHNFVNAKLGKPLMAVEAARELYR